MPPAPIFSVMVKWETVSPIMGGLRDGADRSRELGPRVITSYSIHYTKLYDTVYLAEDLKHHRKVAIKVLRQDVAQSRPTMNSAFASLPQTT